MAAAALVSFGLIVLLRPLLQRYALARPNARSSHRMPTPQGGGIAVIGAALAVAAVLPLATGAAVPPTGLAVLAGATLGLAVLGAVDDVRPLSAALRFPLQILAVASVVAVADPGRILPEAVPLAIERALIVLAGTWWVNLVNFMDGIDWMSVAEGVPLTAALAAFGVAGILSPDVGGVAAALCGALLGFAPANRPVARLFLGDVGSLPIGLLTGWALLHLAAAGHLAAALILPLYYLADATLTLLRRAVRGERVWEAHRSHFYQRALDNGLTVIGVDARVFGANLVLAGLAAGAVAVPALAPVLVAAAGLLVAGLLRRLARPRPA